MAKQNDTSGKVVVITGASSGIGKTTGEYLAQRGYSVYGLSRTKPDGESPVRNMTADVTDSVQVEKSIREILNREGKIDVLVNNAGMGVSGSIEATPETETRRQLEVNFWGTVNACRTVLPSMRSRRNGMIINMSSIGGLIGLPYQGYYSASKFAIEGLSEALRMEVAPFGIRVYLVEPGDLKTGFTANRQKTHEEPEDYAAQYAVTTEIFEKDETGGEDPFLAARRIDKLIRKQPRGFRYIVSDPLEKIAPFAKKILPYSFFEKIIAGHYGIRR